MRKVRTLDAQHGGSTNTSVFMVIGVVFFSSCSSDSCPACPAPLAACCKSLNSTSKRCIAIENRMTVVRDSSSFAAINDRSIRIDGPESCSFDKGALCSLCHRVEIGQRIRSVCCTQFNSSGRMILKKSPKRNEIAYECIRLMESFL